MDKSRSELAVETILELELENLGSLSPSHCIIRVPEMFCNANEEAYTPRTISIGPYHSKTSNLKGMHHHKIRYLQYFLQRTEIELRTFVEMAREWEAQVRKCYDEDMMKLNSNELVMMIVIDGIFLVEFLLRAWEKQETLVRVPGSKDVRFKKTEEDELFRWTCASDIIRDLFLLENQLPLFIFQRLYRCYRDDIEWTSILFSICLHCLDPSSPLGASIEGERKNISSGFELDTQNKMHLVDCLHSICTPKYWENSTEIIVKKVYRRHVALTRSTTELHEAGVEFGPRVGNGTLPFQVNFDDKLGELQIAPLTVNMQTESMFRNVIAHEHLHRKDKIFCSYVVFMYYLMKTRHDVDLLIKSNVIVNYLGESEEICTLFTNLFKITLRDCPDDFSYSRICLGLNNYSRNWWYWQRARWFKWTARDFFGAALVLLALTLIQTLCSIKSTNWNWNRW